MSSPPASRPERTVLVGVTGGIAIYKAVSEGEKEFEVIAVVTPNGGTPCGGCRQVMAEFGLNMVVLIANGEGRLVQETSVTGLLPEAFTPKDLGK